MDPDDLLAQIAELMEEYLSMGDGTPAFAAVSQALPGIQSAIGDDEGALEEGAPAETLPGEGGEMMPPPPNDLGAGPLPGGLGGMMSAPLPEGESEMPTTFAGASDASIDFLKKRKAKTT